MNVSKYFANVVLDLRFPVQTKTSVVSKTFVGRQASQSENRRPSYSYPMRKFTLDSILLGWSDVQYFIRFFEARQGSLQGFKFLDISNYRLTARPLVIYYNATTEEIIWTQGLLYPSEDNQYLEIFQSICSRQKDGSISQVLKPIYLPSDDVIIKDLTNLSTVNPNRYVVDHYRGKVSGIGSVYGKYGIDCSFHTPVRFGADILPLNLTSVVPGKSREFDLPNITISTLSGNFNNTLRFPDYIGATILDTDELYKARLGSIDLIEYSINSPPVEVITPPPAN